ncbi:MAG TPA: hypothetical protein VFI41_12555 [Gemmatimonadales bacterium]|nr:hypothetical protein [Gemmatimonadales bacterium]
MLELCVTLNNEQVELLDKHLVLHEVGLLDELADGVNRMSMPEEDEVTRMVVILHALRAEIRKHQVYCTEKDREDIRTTGRRLALLRRMRTPKKARTAPEGA